MSSTSHSAASYYTSRDTIFTNIPGVEQCCCRQCVETATVWLERWARYKNHSEQEVPGGRVARLRRFVRSGFDRMAVHVEYAVDNVRLGHKFCRTILFSPHTILPHSSTLTATGVCAACSGRRNPAGVTDFSVPQNNHIGSQAHPDSYSVSVCVPSWG